MTRIEEIKERAEHAEKTLSVESAFFCVNSVPYLLAQLTLHLEALEVAREHLSRVRHNASYSANKAHTTRDREVFAIILSDANLGLSQISALLKGEGAK